jgi:hypothetical protein
MKKLLLLFISVFLFASFSNSQNLVENFEYGTVDDTSLVTLTTNWTRHSGVMGPAYSATGLTYAGYPGSGVGGAVSFRFGSSGINDGDIHRSFSPGFSTTGDYYFAFLVRLDSARATGDYFFHVGPSNIGTIFRLRVFARDSSGGNGYVVGLSKSSEAAVYSTIALSYDQTYLFIAKYSFNTAATNDDLVQLYVYDSGVPVVEPGSPIINLGPVGAGVASDPADLGSVAIRQGTNTPVGRVDGIRVSSSWSDVVPVELTSFTANSVNNTIVLKWTTATETNNSGFEIERKNNSTWQRIGFVKGHGTTVEAKSYSFTDKNVSTGKYSYRLKQIDYDGTFDYSNIVEAVVAAPLTFELTQNYPNPFNPSTAIQFSLPKAGNVSLKLYNMLGQEVRTIFNGFKEAGVHTINFNAERLQSGIYLYKIETEGNTQVRKMTLIK